MHPSLNIDNSTLTAFCVAHRIRKLALFGSQLKGTARQNSDVDLLVEFESGAVPGLIGLIVMEQAPLNGCTALDPRPRSRIPKPWGLPLRRLTFPFARTVQAWPEAISAPRMARDAAAFRVCLQASPEGQ
jgi:hypothetical protein